MLLKIEELLAKDKALHFTWMFFIIKVCMLFTTNSLILLLITIVIAVSKEIYDLKIKKTKFDWWDILATVIGGLVSIFLI